MRFLRCMGQGVEYLRGQVNGGSVRLNMKQRMNIYITTGRKNLRYAYVAIKSLFINNQDREIHLYVVSEDLTSEDMRHEHILAEQYGHRIHILRFDEETAAKYIHIDKKDHWPIGTMSSYWLFHELLPDEIDRIMVIESDTVVIGSLSDLYDMDFEDAYVICPGPEHKPSNHRCFMNKIDGDTLTFVLSIYNVQRIRREFSLQDILSTDEKVKRLAGYSQMEFTFGLLFKDHIKYIPGRISCIDENERYMEELGYDYIVECEKTARILHFSSYQDYGKPWNPVSMMPGYVTWWKYAQESPYYKEYFEEQWKLYAKLKKEREHSVLMSSNRNVLLCAFGIYVVMAMIIVGCCTMLVPVWCIILLLLVNVFFSILLSVCVRKAAIRIGYVKK